MVWLIKNKIKANLFIKNSFYNVKKFDIKINQQYMIHIQKISNKKIHLNNWCCWVYWISRF